MAIGITTILTITFLLGSLNGFMPRVSYPKALDWYLLVSFTLTFLSLVECMIVFVVFMSENKAHDDQVCLIVFCVFVFLRPRPYVSVFVRKWRFFIPFQKKETLSHLVLYNPLCPSTRKPNSDRKWYPPWWEHAHSLATEPVTKYFSKTSVFIHPHKHRKTSFPKSPHWRAFFQKDAFLETVYTGNVRMVGQTEEKNLHFQTETDTCRRWDVKKRQLNGHKTNLHCGYKSWKKKRFPKCENCSFIRLCG